MLTAALLALVGISTASPILSPRQANTTLITLSAVAPNTHLQGLAINATYGAFYINRPVTADCPVSAPGFHCPAGNLTVVDVGTSGASMYADVPGGQPLYIPPSGNLSYAMPHLESEPVYDHYNVTGFAFTPSAGQSAADSDGSPQGRFTFAGNGPQGWLACPVIPFPNVFQIFASVSTLTDQDVPNKSVKACTPIEIAGTLYNGPVPAFEY